MLQDTWNQHVARQRQGVVEVVTNVSLKQRRHGLLTSQFKGCWAMNRPFQTVDAEVRQTKRYVDIWSPALFK